MSHENILASLLLKSKLYMQGRTYFDSNLIPAIDEALNNLKSDCDERDQLRELCWELKDSLRNHYWNDFTKHSKAIEDLITKAENVLNGGE